MNTEKATCRGCGMELNGTPYFMGGQAYHPETGETCSISFWGGYVCSEDCDRSSDQRQKQSIDEHVLDSRRI